MIKMENKIQEIKDLRIYDTVQILALINESLREVNSRSLPYILIYLSLKDKVSKPSDNNDLKKVCRRCFGEGKIHWRDDGALYDAICPVCNGKPNL